MKAALAACVRALTSLGRPAMLWHLVWPGLLSLALWLGLAIHFWSAMAAWLLHALRGLPLLGALLADGSLFGVATAVVAHFFLAALLLPLAYVTTLLLVGTLALPLMLDQVAQREYPHLEARRGGSLLGSLVNALYATLLFLILLILSLPLWLIPGVGLVLPLLLSAWLNQRVYRYDALMQHADQEEFRLLKKQCRGGLTWVGLGTGLLAWVPLANLLAPAFSGLASIHYCLGALTEFRKGETQSPALSSR